MSHSMLEPIVELEEVTAEKTTLRELLTIAREQLGEESTLEFNSELVVCMQCPNCGQETPVFKQMARLYESEFACPNCGERREMQLTHRITGHENFLDRTLSQVDVPPLGIIRCRNGKERIYFELSGDKETFLKFE